jgi:hypothetical protein
MELGDDSVFDESHSGLSEIDVDDEKILGHLQKPFGGGASRASPSLCAERRASTRVAATLAEIVVEGQRAKGAAGGGW